MQKQEVLIRKRSAVYVQPAKRPRAVNLRDSRALAFQAEAMRYGFMFSEELLETFSTLGDARIASLYRQVIPVLQSMTGADVAWEPFYPNFPKQVQEASDWELFVNAIVHYWSYGQWKPEYEKEARLPAFEAVHFTIIGLAGNEELGLIFAEILGSNASVSDADREIMIEIMGRVSEKALTMAMPESIPFKENLCWFVSECVTRKWQMAGMAACRTATDVLRVATGLSGGDISLATNTRFKSFRRPVRRMLVLALEQVINKDDIFRHRGKWIRLAHALHVGDFAKPCPQVWAILSDARDRNSTYQTFNAKVEAALVKGKGPALISLLKQRPGVFARRLDHAIRTVGWEDTVDGFSLVADQVDTRVLMQLYGHMKARQAPVNRRMVFPKGGQGKSHILTQELPALAENAVLSTQDVITDVLHDRFSELESLGDTVWIDPALKECPIPLSLRSASDSLVTVARGTKMPLGGDKGTIRMFIYWKGQDIDLSGFFVNEDFTRQDTIAYYNLRGDFGHHSGDIVSAPRGACEFIDVNIEKALAAGHRYLVMSVLVFSGPKFSEHEICYAGWMTRSKPNSNEIFDPKTVEQKVDLTCDSKNAIPVIFDLKERKAIWLDLSTNRGSMTRPNNVNTNKPSLYDAVTGAMNLDNKPTLYDLFDLHARARCQYITEDRSEADVTFGWDGDVKPTDTTAILSDYLS